MPTPPAPSPEAAPDVRGRNLAAFGRHHPEALRRILDGLPAGPSVALERLRGGSWGLRGEGGAWLEGPGDPEAAAREVAGRAGAAEAEVVVLFCLGTGNLLVETLRVAPLAARVVLALLDVGAARATLAERDLSDALADPRLEIAAGGLAAVARALPRTDARIAVVVHEPLLGAVAPDLEPLAAMATELAARHASWRTQRADVLDNVESNLDAVLDAAPASALAATLSGRPVLIVAPGPSLDDDLVTLERRPRPPLVALDTAARPLVAARVVPDLIVTLDPSPSTASKLTGVPARVPLLFFEGARPELVARHRARAFACERGGLLDAAHPRFGRDGTYESGGSVLHAALDVLLALGAGPIALVGADLAVEGSATHARGVEGAGGDRHPAAKTRRLPARHHGTVATTESLWRHRRRLMRRLAVVEPGRVVDATRRGASIGNVEALDLATFCDRHGARAVSEELCEPLRRHASQEPADADRGRDAARRAAVAAVRRARSESRTEDA